MSDEFDVKYGIVSDAAAQELHRQRRMFAIKREVLHIAPPASTDSHAKWFERLGWITLEDTQAMEEVTRGFANNTGLYFYRGFDFRVDETAERIFFHHFRGLVRMISLDPSLQVYGGMIRQEKAGCWPPRKEYGTIESLLIST